MNLRHERMEQDAKVALSKIISYEVKNSLVSGLLSVTDVKITPDQKYAKVYISIFGRQNKDKVLGALKSSSGFIRSSLGRKIHVRNVPALSFVLDDSIEYGSHMEKLIKGVIENDEKQSNASNVSNESNGENEITKE